MPASEPLTGTIARDFFHLICGEKLGFGLSRDVFVFEWDPRYVVKFEAGAQSFQNVTEWNTWQDAQHHDEAAKWLAPCVKISACGCVLIQRRTRPAKKLPDKVPAFFTDLKASNFGMIGSKFVCHDYGINLMCNSGLTTRLRKADWDHD